MESSGYKESANCQQPLLSSSQTTQTITFGANEERWSSAVVSSDVRVEVSATSHTSGSSAITTRNISNYSWDHHYLSGSLVAQHSSGNYVAYAIRAPQKTSGMVRIINNKTGDRGLVRNIRGMVRDLAFAHITNRIILAFTDQFGTLYVCEVTDTANGSTLNTDILVEVASTTTEQASDHHRVIWCPYIPDEQVGGEEGDEPAHLLVLTHGPCAEIWNISVVLREHGGIQLRREQVASGYQLMEQHSAPITDAAFSPDGTALATAALDGYVKFFQVYMADEEKCPRCLHQWNPHDGKPLSALFFLDDHKHHSPDVQFWKYAVTGACNNSELRVWSCESWQCHQTLRFVPTLQDPPQTPLIFKATMDPSANFLVLSDIHRRVIYVIVVYQDGNSGGGGGGGGNSISGGIGGGNCCVVKNSSNSGVSGSAQLVSVSELPVQYPALFLSITDAAWKPYKRWKHDHTHDASQNTHDEEDMESLDMVDGVVLRCVLINTVSLQEATLRFKPDIPLPAPPQHHHDLNVSRDSIGVRDGLTDLSLNTSVSEVDTAGSGEREEEEEEQPPPPPPPPDALTSPQSSSLTSQHNTSSASQPPMNLLTPDSFSSPRRPEDSDLPEEDNEEGSMSSKVTPNKYDVAYAPDFENAALSLLLRCGSGTLMQSSDSESSSSLKILGSVVAGSSTTPPATSLPPPPSSTPHPGGLQVVDPDEVPLASSEVVVSSSGGVGRTGASTTSSPSLEVQQILHSQNGKSEEFADEDDEDLRARDEAGMAEDEEEGDDEEEEEEEEEEGEEEEDEPEAHRQPTSSHSHPPPPPPSDHQPLPQPPPASIVKPVTALPQPSVIVKPKPPTSLPQQPTPVPQPPSSLPQPPLPLPEQSPSSASQPPTSVQQSPSSLPPPSSLPQLPPSSLPQSLPSTHIQPSSAATQPATSIPPPLNTLAQLTQKQSGLHGHDVQHPKAPAQSLVFASVRSLPTQLTCAQLEAEIKAGTASPEISSSPAAMTSQSTSQAKNGRGYSSTSHPSDSPAADQLNGPLIPAVTVEDVAELRTLMMGCVSVSREQGQAAASQTRSLASKLDKALHHMTQLAKQVEEVKTAQSQIQMELPRALAASLRPVVEGTLRNELRTVVLPGVVKSLEPLNTHLTQEVHTLTKNSEGQIMDGLTKVIHSRSFIDGIVGSVGSAVAASVQSSCRDAYNKLLLPGLNALTQQIFAQVNENFSRGTREYLQNLENEVQGGRTAVQESMGKASQSLSSACSSLSSHSKSLQDNVNKLVAHQNTLSDSLTERIRGLVREEVAHALQDHQATLDARSRAHTPGPAPHAHNSKVAQQQVQALISQGQFNTAFKQALSASDLSLVMFVCERVNPQQVFNMTPCPLSQDVLLSLVNQLSHDLSTFTDLKIKYLEEAIMNLDSSHPVTREHMRSVLQGFQRNMNMYLMTNPTHKKVKMLLMAVNHLATS